MDSEDLALMGVSAPGHRQRMLTSIAYLRNHPGPSAAPAASHSSSKTSYVSAIVDVSPSSSPAADVDLSAEPPLNVGAEKPDSPPDAQGDDAASDPSAETSVLAELAEEDLIPEGCIHSASALNSGAVQYTAQYLGSRVSSVHGSTKATVKAVSKMRASGKLILNKPPISLNLTTGAIRFLDPTTQTVIVSHDMATVKFPAQDTTDPTMLAYLTSQAKPDGAMRHLCHVFRVETALLAGDIVSTMQQAQEVGGGGDTACGPFQKQFL
jgi:hypothetical protein